ncbi:MAG: MarR family transcriptional regulator [Pseudomonadales bacterium]|nr:MarR family transcriptional regulator [Pseudomonadales bacterium]
MDISDSLTYHITKTGNLLRQVTAKRIRSAGINLTPEESALMNQLWDKNTQTISELGQWSVKDSSTLTRQIDGLVKKGYVERNHGIDDRRQVFVSLTTAGKQLKKAFNKTRVSQLDADMVNCSSKDMEKVLAILTNIREQALQELKS